MDFSKFKTSDWLKVGGAIGFFIFGFLDWAKYDFAGQSVTGNSVFDYPLRGIVSWILVIGTGVVTVLLAQGKSVGKMQWPLVMLLATAVATILMLLLVIMGPDDSGVDFKPAIGLYLAFAATIVSLVGSFLGFKETGGDLNDLKDINKIKGSFGQGGGGGSTPPPPPPPPPPPMA